MTTCDHVPLGEICTVNPRAGRHTGADDTAVSFVPMAAVDGRTGTITDPQERRLAEVGNGFTAFEEGDVLLAKITPCMENGKATLARNLTNGIGRGSTEFFVLRPGRRVLGEYVWHFVRQPRFRDAAKRSFTGTAGQQRVPKSFVENALIPVPPLEEQRRIVDILNRAARIEALRRRASERLREFVPALFVKMFGDPAENPMGWEVRALADLVQEFRYGTSRKCYDAADGEDALPVLRIPNVLHGGVDWTDLKFTSLRGDERTNLKLARGDILFVRTNGNPEHIGRCAVFSERREAAYASYLIRARLEEGAAVAPEYVSAGLALPTMRQTLLRLTRTTAGNYNISIDLLGRIRIPVPEPMLQQKFSAIIARTRDTLNRTEVSVQTSSAVSASLMRRLLSLPPVAHSERARVSGHDAQESLRGA